MAALPANNTFEGVADETTVSTSNSAAGGTAFEVVTIGAGNGLVYDTARAAHLSASARMDLGNASGQVCAFGWTFTAVNELWNWMYVYATGNPTATLRIFGWENAGGGVGRMNWATTGQLQLLDRNFAGAAVTAASVPLNDWYRIWTGVRFSSTVGRMEVRIYQGDQATPIANGTAATDSVRDTGTDCNRATFGSNSTWAGTAQSFWMDDPNANVTGAIGPGSGDADNPPMGFSGRGAGW